MAESAGKEDPVELDSSLTFVKRHKRCRIGGSFGAGEIPLPLLFFYLLNEAELGFAAQFLALRSFSGQSGLRTLSGGEFGWGGTSVKP